MAKRPTMTPEQRAEARARRRAAVDKVRAERHRYYISINVKGSYIPGTKPARYRKYAWPKLFLTKEDAWAFADAMNPFKNSAATAERGRIRSYSVEFILLREPQTWKGHAP